MSKLGYCVIVIDKNTYLVGIRPNAQSITVSFNEMNAIKYAGRASANRALYYLKKNINGIDAKVEFIKRQK